MSEIITADAFDALADMESETVHAVVTDPPYGLAFMGRDWDDFEPKEYQTWCGNWARKVKRVLKPGGHLLAFSGNRTHHRLFSGVEDAGFEIRDTLTWHYGSGFPKALDVSKAMDKAAGAEREVVGRKPNKGRADADGWGMNSDEKTDPITAPATDAARKWGGWKTALKPATEFIVLARKPFEVTVAENVQEHGTGALNIDGCRLDGDVDTTRPDGPNNPEIYGEQTNGNRGSATGGRYPANVVFDEAAAEALDREEGERVAGDPKDERGSGGIWSESEDGVPCGPEYGDKGGPSRYFYTSKATRAERTLDGRIDNAHPTVKPVDLMGWLVRLVTAEGQTVLDPFAGTGTTCRAAKNLGREFIGVEKQPKWADVARVRCGLTPDDPEHVRSDDAQAGIEAFADTSDG